MNHKGRVLNGADLCAGGAFATAGGKVSAYIARAYLRGRLTRAGRAQQRDAISPSTTSQLCSAARRKTGNRSLSAVTG